MSSLKIAFGMIVFNSDFVLKQCLEQVYPFATQILIAEGPVQFWQDNGFTTSVDQTNEILNNFPDPENKIKIVHGQWSEKDEQCNAYMKFLRDDIDYLINLDADEVYKTEDLKKLLEYLEKEQPTSVGVQSLTFFGGFNSFITGFEMKTDNFLRIFRVTPGCKWLTHRPPTIQYPAHIQRKHINSKKLYEDTGIQMYHYSYVFPFQVESKMEYYKAKVSRDNCIDDYFWKVWLPWVTGDASDRDLVEDLYNGVHEFKRRVPAYTARWTGTHPEAIERDMQELMDEFRTQLEPFK